MSARTRGNCIPISTLSHAKSFLLGPPASAEAMARNFLLSVWTFDSYTLVEPGFPSSSAGFRSAFAGDWLRQGFTSKLAHDASDHNMSLNVPAL